MMDGGEWSAVMKDGTWRSDERACSDNENNNNNENSDNDTTHE